MKIGAARPVAVFQRDGAWYRGEEPVRQFVAERPSDVVSVLDEAEAAADAGHYVAGYVSYEAAGAFGLAAHQPADGLPLAAFFAFERLEPFDAATFVAAAQEAPELDWQPAISEEEYQRRVQRVRQHLAAGDTYQVNLTFPLRATCGGDPFALFARLVRAQRAPGAMYLDLGGFAICSGSPELFFARDGDLLTMRPMKGTAPRGRTLAEDRERAARLRRSPKERAENLMIVDMVRNDLGRIARPGSVAVPALWRVEKYPTVLQMTSAVQARSDAALAEVFEALFPCASVTGAPKVRTAQLIHELEGGPRGVYTGAIGYLGPGRRAEFSVAIRTATVDRARGTATYPVGSGIVWDSRPGREYAECIAKARVLQADVRPFALLETLRWEPGEAYVLLDRHLRRQAASARYFGFPYDRRRVRKALDAAASGDVPLRVRLLIGEDGEPSVEAAPLPPASGEPVRVGLAKEPLDPSNPFLFHKTTRRDVYEAAKASRPDCDQVLLWTPTGRVTETDIANIAVRRDGRWVTPPARDGLLAGTMRAELLARGAIAEGPVTVDELSPATEIAVFNSVRGWLPAKFVG